MKNISKKESLLIGKKYNHLTIISYKDTLNNKKIYTCQCVCGKIIDAYIKYVKDGSKKSCGCQKLKPQFKDLTNQVFGKLKVIKKDNCKSTHTKWICKCECGLEKSILGTSLSAGKTKSCGCIQKSIVSKLKSTKKFEEIPLTYIRNIKSGAKKRNLNVHITIEDIWKIYLNQNKKCYFTGLPIGFCDIRYKSGHISNSASLDRIDSSKDYMIDNCCLVYKDINFMKQNFPVDKFLNYCKLIVEHINKK